MPEVVAMLTKWAGPAMVMLQAILCLGHLYLGKTDPALYWGGGVLLTVGALRMSGWTL
jgi:hypothetical protein